MAGKVSLKKTQEVSAEQIQALNAKLDFLIDEVQDLRRNMRDLQTANKEQLYKVDSQLYSVCSDLKSQIYKFQSEFYDGSHHVKEELKELQKQTSYSRFMDKMLPWSPAILIGGGIWAMVLLAIFS